MGGINMDVASRPVVCIPKMVLFPGTRLAFRSNEPRLFEAVEWAMNETGGYLAIFACRSTEYVCDMPGETYEVGTLARVLEFRDRTPCGCTIAEVKGLVRIKALEFLRHSPFPIAVVQPIWVPYECPCELEPIAAAIRTAVASIRERYPSNEHIQMVTQHLTENDGPMAITGVVSDLLFQLGVDELQSLLEIQPLSAQMTAILARLDAL